MKLDILSIGVPPTFDIAYLRQAYLISQEAAGCTPKTIGNIGCAFNSFERFLQTVGVSTLDCIDANSMRSYILHERNRGQSDRSVQTYLISLKGFFRWCVDENYSETSPMVRVKMPRIEKKVIEAFTDDEIRRLLSATSGPDSISVRNRALVTGLLDSGLRAAEFVGMKVGDIDLANGLFMVSGKGRKQRHVRMGANARKCVIRYLQLRKGKVGEPLWLGVRGPITTSGLFQILNDLGTRCNVQKCNPHKFRRTFALNCLRNGMDPFSLQILMGHSDLQILRQYLAQTRADVHSAHEACSPIDRLLERRRNL